MTYRKIVAAVAAATLCAVAARANDSTAESAAGGLVFTHTDAIDMVSEDLYVSTHQVRVHYVFRNRTAQDVHTMVAFPMPDLDLSPIQYAGQVAYPGEFHTSVDGHPVAATVEAHASLHGRDYTALLESLHVPLAPGGTQADPAAIERALYALPAAAQQRLTALGLVRADDVNLHPENAEGHSVPGLRPLWTVREVWHWDQVFPAGRDLVVEHGYQPGVGSGPGTGVETATARRSADGRAAIAEYCMDSSFLSAIDRWMQPNGEATDFDVEWVSYVLVTGANWRSPIHDFRLVVDKGDPRAIVSFCGTGVRRISPTQYEVRYHDWRPTRDLHVMIVHDPSEPARTTPATS